MSQTHSLRHSKIISTDYCWLYYWLLLTTTDHYYRLEAIVLSVDWILVVRYYVVARRRGHTQPGGRPGHHWTPTHPTSLLVTLIGLYHHNITRLTDWSSCLILIRSAIKIDITLNLVVLCQFVFPSCCIRLKKPSENSSLCWWRISFDGKTSFVVTKLSDLSEISIACRADLNLGCSVY